MSELFQNYLFIFFFFRSMPKQASIRDHFQNKHDRALSEKQQSVNKKHALLPTKPIKIKQDNHVLIQHIIEREASSFFKKQRQAHMMQTKPTYPTRSLEKNEIEALMDRNFGQTWHKDRCCQYLMQHHAPQEKTAVLWKDKYLPNQIEGLLGNMSNYQFLVQWLNQLKIDTQHTKMGSNLILIVGKHGVGKTASIYTIAKEMGYSVFEINPSTKRSGKEVLDSVGGMTESHLVRFDAMDLEKKRKFEQREAIVIRDRVKKPKMDITRHFKPVNEKKSIEENKQELDLDRHTVMKSNYKATESLILLEEVDILFEEDKGFWQALIELSHKSKRPIIMTCNNDTQNIPYDQLYLQKILYFDTPTKDSLVPYLQLVCYLENYDRVRTIDIEYLCRLYDYDIRRILNTLQLWLSKDMQEYLFAHIMGFADLLDTMNLQSLMDRLQNTDSKTKIICQEYYVDYYDCTPHEYDLNQISHLLDMCSFVDAYISPTDKQIHQVSSRISIKNTHTILVV
ncbi:P-loop containing nucleoside triphosphate hydrolase protein [Gilbertella persicaria]|uniref:P-loop containing nucleoside triphosphate hydrolase protein n=1 Tax=Gilbertella persicaria TaxID=101096 RepID=UPI00221E82CF|nr:P-loop containing nucleoside triphosphate hydrolase protein [Gilbertella persicaria]KAI8075383.1 P-loop containing nucleoside triphosphate hydrolase protein [Gilbertella persicaria]